MNQSRSEVVRRLVQAQRDQVPVGISALDPHTHGSLGFVVAVANEWIVLQSLQEGFFLDDLVLVRLENVKKVKSHPHSEFATRAVAALGAPIEEFECPPDITTSELLRVVAARANLVCLTYQEQGHCWREIGSIRAVGSKRLEVHAIGDDGKWFEDSGLRRTKHIRRVEFGGRYLAAFEQLGQELPPPSAEATKRIASLT